MKTSRIIVLILTAIAVFLVIAPVAAGQKSESNVTVPKYDPAAEARFSGTVEEVRDRQCPVSGGMGSHLILRLSASNTIEVHLASTKFVKSYELVFNKGDVVTVVGTKWSLKVWKPSLRGKSSVAMTPLFFATKTESRSGRARGASSRRRILNLLYTRPIPLLQKLPQILINHYKTAIESWME